MSKKYFWLKLNSDFFDQTHIKFLRKLPDGDKLVIVYLKMQLKSLKNNGILYFEGILEDYIAEIAMSIDEEINIVTLCISALQKMKLIELLEGNNVFLVETLKITGKESESAERVRQYRLNKGEKALQCNEDVTESNVDVTKCNTEKRRDREEKELELEKEPLLKKASKTHTPLQETIEDFKKHRKQMKAPMTDRAVLLLYKDLDKLASTDEEKILILEQSIFKGWKGVFQLKEGFIQEKKIDFEKERLLKRGEWADMMAEREKRGESTDNKFDQWLFDNNLKHLTREGTYNES